MEIGNTYDLFCIDCDTITQQTYKGISQDGTHLYSCDRCGCENTEEFSE